MAEQILNVEALKKYKPDQYYSEGTARFLKDGVAPIAGTTKTIALPSGGGGGERSLGTTDELGNVNTQITDTQSQLDKYGNQESYLGLMKSVFNASYANNAGLINAKGQMREALYGDYGYKPSGYDMLSPDQQSAIKNSNKAGLASGIQTLNETMDNRNQGVTDLMTQMRNEGQERRQLLSDNLTRLENRRGELESAQADLKSENRTFALNAITQYPALAQMLTEQELGKINKGDLDESILAKISQASAEFTEDSQITTTTFPSGDGNTYIIGLNPDGSEAYRTLLGKTKVSPGSNTTPSIDKLRNRLPEGYDFELQTDGGGGINFIGPDGNIPREQWFNETHIPWQEVVAEVGSLNPQDYPGSEEDSGLSESDKMAINTEISKMLDDGKGDDEIKLYIRFNGGNPKDFGYTE